MRFVSKPLFALSCLVAAMPCAAAVTVTTDKAVFAAGNVVTAAGVEDSDYINGDPSFVKLGITFSTINLGAGGFKSYFDDTPSSGVRYIYLIDSAFAILSYGSFGIQYTSLVVGTGTIYVDGEVVDTKTSSLGFLGFLSDNASSPTVVTIQYASRSAFGIQTVSTAVPAVSPPDMPPSSDVPEPDLWVMMIAGFGAVGVAMRRRRIAVRFA